MTVNGDLVFSGSDIAALLTLALPIASVAWTVTHEEVFREAREWCDRQSTRRSTILARKFFYLFTCEYCFSHWVTLIAVVATRFRLLYPDWRGSFVAGFALVWIANVYMGLFGRLRLDIKHEKVEIAVAEAEIAEVTDPAPASPPGRFRDAPKPVLRVDR
jgi:hypothetical protein